MLTRREGEALFLEIMPRLEDLIRQTCFRRRLGTQEREDLRSLVFEHLIDRNYRVLRSFEGRSLPTTFLRTVIRRLLIDQRFRSQGRWRPSATARRLGPVGILLDQLLHRDGFTHREAIEIAQQELGEQATRSEIFEICLRLPARPPRQRAGELEIETLKAPVGTDWLLFSRERVGMAERIETDLNEAFEALEPDERLILKLRYHDGLSVRQIGERLGLDPKPLYHLCNRCLGKLRSCLAERGIRWREIREVVEATDTELCFDYGLGSGSETGRANRSAQGSL